MWAFSEAWQCISYPDFINIIGVVHGLAEVAVSGRSGAQEQLERQTLTLFIIININMCSRKG